MDAETVQILHQARRVAAEMPGTSKAMTLLLLAKILEKVCEGSRDRGVS